MATPFTKYELPTRQVDAAPFSTIEALANRLLETFITLTLLVLLFTALPSYYVSRLRICFTM